MLACGNENLAGNFFSKCLSRVFLLVEIFSTNFLTQDECRDIFDIFFSPSIARVEKYIENVEAFVECRKSQDRQKYLRQALEKKIAQLNFH